MHFTNGGKHVDTGIDGNHTLFVADVTCGNCKRTRNYRAAVDSQTAIRATTMAIESISSAGFVINHNYRNHATDQSYYITAVDRFGIRVTAQNEWFALTFPTLSEFLAWITPQDMDVDRIIEHVTDAGMTWVDAVDLEWSLAAEVKSVETIEYVVNDALMSRIRDMAKTEGLPVAEPVTDPAACKVHPGGYNIPGTAVCVGCENSGTHAMEGPVLADPYEAWVAECAKNPSYEIIGGHPYGRKSGLPIFRNVADNSPGILARHRARMAAEAAKMIAEDAGQMPTPFHTSGKVKNTRQARRARRGA